MKNLLLALLLFSPAPVLAQLSFEPLSVHPTNVAAGSEFLLAVEDRWANGCGGEIAVEVSADRIEVAAISVSEDLLLLCTQEIMPFADLIRPRQSFAGTFADQVTIDYVFVAADGDREQRASRTLTFSDVGNSVQTVETGSWVAEELESSGLFIDQQGDLLSANLADYANGSGAWFFGAAPVSGNIVIAELNRYANIVCVTTPCSRAAPTQTGTLLAVLEDRNSLLVKYENILEQKTIEAGALRYRRLDLRLAAKLGGVPDLAGQWIIGIGPGDGNGPANSFAVFDLVISSNEPIGGLETVTFSARNINRLDTSVEPDFVIDCQDARPVDGELACTSGNLSLGDGDCLAFFPFQAAAIRRVSGTVSCSGNAGDFVMVRR